MTRIHKILISLFHVLMQRLKDSLKRTLPDRVQAIIRRIRLSISFHKKYIDEMREAKRILRGLQNGNITKVLIVYDNLASPPTYGDYLFVVMFARYFISQDIFVSFIIVDWEYRSDWSALNEDGTKNLVADYVRLANLMLDPLLATVEVLTFPNLQLRVKENFDNGMDVPFQEAVVKREPLYCHMNNILSRLCSKASRDHLDRFLLSFDELEKKISVIKPEQPYITWACRYSSKWRLEANLSENEFIQTYTRFKAVYPSHAVMVVSDEVGCNYFKEIAVEYGMKCLFSKDYSDTLEGDGLLILGSELFFMIRGGGIGVFSLFSRIPYEIIASTSNEVHWRPEKITSWANDNQIFRLPHGDQDIYPSR